MVDRLPLTAIKKLLVELRKQYFSVSRPSATGLKVYASHDEVKALLQDIHFHDVAKYSYEYEGEVLNLSRPEHTYGKVEGDKIPDSTYIELHGRSFNIDEDSCIFFYGHLEVSRFQHWREHIDATVIEWDTARDKFKAIFEEHGIPCEVAHESEVEIKD